MLSLWIVHTGVGIKVKYCISCFPFSAGRIKQPSHELNVIVLTTIHIGVFSWIPISPATYINSLSLSDVYMHHQTRPSLVQIMA